VLVTCASVGIALAGLVATARPAAADGAPPAPASFHPIAPVRLLDSRAGTGGPAAPFGGTETRLVDVGGLGGVPADAVAVVLNVTVTEPTAGSYLTVWPAGTERPTASNLNMVPGQTVANMVTVGLGAEGRVAVYNHAGATHVVADVTGWYSAGFHPLTPARLLDTREAAPGAFGAGEARDLTVGGAGAVPPTAIAVALNVTVTEPTASGFLTVWPAGSERPTASNLNMVPGQTVPNMVVVGLGAGGAVSIFNFAGNSHVVVDVAGWFESGFHPLVPSRIVDTREGRCLARVGPGETRLVAVSGQGGVPAATAGAVVLNVTITNATAATYLTLWPSGQPQPPSSNVNVVVGTVPNLVTVGVGADGRVALYNRFGTADVIVDVAGWYEGQGGPAGQPCETAGGAPGEPLRNELAPGAGGRFTTATYGDRGDDIAALQVRLAELGFWVPDTGGAYGHTTGQAVMAFQKYIGVRATGVVDELTGLLLRMQTLRPVARSTAGDLVEVDKPRQVLFVVRGGKVLYAVNTSTGSDIPYTEPDRVRGGTTSGDAHTHEGKWKVYHEYADGWESGQLGELYRPKYFYQGEAVHGSTSIPNYPASHGCVRVSTAFMDFVWATDLMPKGSQVWVY
jgi:peptidoglycan hydrolase-like protein with peptidoglycan-binding domain